jgi:hypothetical protein
MLKRIGGKSYLHNVTSLISRILYFFASLLFIVAAQCLVLKAFYEIYLFVIVNGKIDKDLLDAIAVALEGLVGIFEAANKDFTLVLWPLALILASVFIMIGLGIFLRLVEDNGALASNPGPNGIDVDASSELPENGYCDDSSLAIRGSLP